MAGQRQVRSCQHGEAKLARVCVSQRRECGSGDLPGHPHESSAECGLMLRGKQTLLPPKAGGGTTWKERRESLWVLQTMRGANTGTGTPTALAALLTVAKRWKQPQFPSSGEGISKLWSTHTMEHCPALKGGTGNSETCCNMLEP